ncbi:MAG TPA: hotdog domain-containing protein [Jatrophihabitans sp.]|jgi:predicted thioesterase|nr:hotdog domain-containing protein [Jatrophihabitans sp.]
MELVVGLRMQLQQVVTEHDTALALGSGDVPVLGTPRLLAWAEAATVAALDGHLAAGSTSVGSYVAVEHRAASAVGASVTVDAELVAVEGRQLRFAVRVDEGDRLVAAGEIVRVIVDRERFLIPRLSNGDTRSPDR